MRLAFMPTGSTKSALKPRMSINSLKHIIYKLYRRTMYCAYLLLRTYATPKMECCMSQPTSRPPSKNRSVFSHVSPTRFLSLLGSILGTKAPTKSSGYYEYFARTSSQVRLAQARPIKAPVAESCWVMTRPESRILKASLLMPILCYIRHLML